MDSQWDKLQNALREGRIGRREFIAAAAALGLSGAPALAETPKRGGHLIIGVTGGNSNDSLSPTGFTADFSNTMRAQLYDTLTVVDRHVKVQPSLAESWTAKPGAKEWVFKICKGVQFHNGKELTAQDVVYSINAHRAKDSKSGAKALVAAIDDIKASDKYEVTFLLSGGNADLPFLMSDFHLCIAPDGSTFTDGVGTGAFAFESFEPGVRGRSKRNPHDWNHERGFVDSIETLAINDSGARLAALLSGSVHLINDVVPNTVDKVKGNSKFQIFVVPGTGYDTFPMLCDTPPFDNLDLRLAMKYAIDRNAILKTVLHGYGRIGNDHPVSSTDPFFAADLPQRPHDPDKAKFHYKKSGHSGELVLSVADVGFSGAIDAAQVFQASAKKAGINLQVNRVPNDGYYANVWNKVPMCGAHWQGRPTADLIFSTVFASTAPWNDAHWRRPKFDELLVAARAELDRAKRKQMYHDMQVMVHEDGGELIPIFTSFIDAGAAKVRGFVPTPINTLGGYRAPEKIWLA